MLLLEEAHSVECDSRHRRDVSPGSAARRRRRRVRRPRSRRSVSPPARSTCTGMPPSWSGDGACSATTVPSESMIAAPRAPTRATTGPSTRWATSVRVVASVISPTIASCILCCSGARQDARMICGGLNPSTKPTQLPKREDLGEQSGDRGLIGRERGEDDREGQGGGGEREHPHAARRNGWLLTARPPEPNGHDDREQRPVDEEHDHVGEEPRRRGSPAAGTLGSANVQMLSPIVMTATTRCSRRDGRTNSVAKR